MHTVIEAVCTGCDLCLPVCPVDCIEMVPVSGDKTAWAAWSPELAKQARQRYEARQYRLVIEEREQAAEKEMARKRAIIEAAMAKAKARQKT